MFHLHMKIKVIVLGKYCCSVHYKYVFFTVRVVTKRNLVCHVRKN